MQPSLRPPVERSIRVRIDRPRLRTLHSRLGSFVRATRALARETQETRVEGRAGGSAAPREDEPGALCGLAEELGDEYLNLGAGLEDSMRDQQAREALERPGPRQTAATELAEEGLVRGQAAQREVRHRG